ncbi:nuclear factor NF-kappa-B p105 subunit-like [Mercenaria mercenaria]|uniref:nuclear factor NF-kappa-B p105 subunit-like n=1 Tax=Mercenaria mercenaria TaxID=6596 RepID=UPI00234F62D5|nr:nuclear factor NF-kappa-B p105 subunit-like [Mercenaria mercenaria]XP_053392567.1 nuclear factor NF-kappa-B p105 subunit-like [Mercenaria mercenaria]XP_053392568.1 nuclear factor NF-kappa-B p105 subunit-like [Mercenaria mercenaria]
MDENGSSRSSSDSVDVSNMDSSPPLLNGHFDMEQFSDEDNGLPTLEIIEQPQQRGFRFRYECEGPSHGGLQGASSERHRKTVPTVKIRNYNGPARVVVSLVTDESVPKSHAHKLVGKHCTDGVCQLDVKAGTSQISFPNLCIQHVTRRKASEVLEQRICNSIIEARKRESKNWNTPILLRDEDKKRAKLEAAAQAKGMHLNVVRLCFQCYLTDNEGSVTAELNSIVSDPIYDSKAPGANALKICRMDKYSGCCTGNDEVFLLCEKVQKDDIMVRFVEQDPEGAVVWEKYGHFGPFDVHRQFAIVFKTPEYRDVNIQTPVNVLVMLQRKSDGESSDPKSFTYYPRIRDKEDIDRKRRKLIPTYHPGSAFGSMKSSIGGTSNGGGAGADGSNGMHNGGSIPNFDNLPLSANHFGQRPLNLGNAGRPVLQAKRTLPSFQQTTAPALYSSAPTDVLSHSTDFVYEEVSNLSPPMGQLQGGGSPQYFMEGQTVGVDTSSNLSAASPYGNSAMMIGSPQNVGQTSVPQFGAGALSPQHQLHPASPQNNFLSQQMPMGSQMQNMPVTETGMSSAQTAQMESDFQMTLNDLKVEQVTQPVQVSTLSSESLEIDFLLSGAPLNTHAPLNTGIFDQYNQAASQVTENRNFQGQYGNFGASYTKQPYMQQSCGFYARGSQDADLQDVIDVLDMVDGAPPRAEPCDDYDEVDSARADRYDMTALTPRSGSSAGQLFEQTAKLEPGMTKAVTVSEQLTVQPEPYTSSVEEEVVTRQPLTSENDTEPIVAKKTLATTETSVPAKSLQRTDSSAQTEMDPMLKLAMKTSEALQYYAASGDIRSLLMVQRFLMAVQDQDGDLPLHTALINQRYEVFQNILDVMVTLPDAYTRINAYNFHHQTPLHLAVITNQPHAVDLLIRAGADTTLVDRNGYTPAHLAVLYARDDCLRNLVKYLRQGVTSKQPFPELNLRCYDGFTPTHLAAQLENLAAMKLLVYGKADVNLPDGKSGRTPLHHAVETDDLSLAAYLILQAGASVNVKRFDGNTALHIACGRGNVGMVALLMAGGADPNIENDDIVSDDTESDESDSQESGGESSENENSDNKNSTKSEDVDDKDTDTEKEPKKSDKDTVDGQEVEEEVLPKRRVGKGLTPADFADCNEKILRVLNGEPYSSITESSPDSIQHVTDKMSSLRFISKDSGHGSMGICSTGGDMCRVEYPVRLSLSQKLDPTSVGSDWQALADKLGMKMLMEGHPGDHSPTRLLLNFYEENGGTVDRLVQALKDIKRDDCVSLLKDLADQSSGKNDEKDSKVLHKDPKYDSGVSDSYNKSPSPVHRGHIVT